jgi:hypothetical protein
MTLTSVLLMRVWPAGQRLLLVVTRQGEMDGSISPAQAMARSRAPQQHHSNGSDG